MSNKDFDADINKDVIELVEFLNYYCGIDIDFENNKVSHRNLKFFGFPGVVSISFGEVRTSDIKTGEVILVRDSYKHIAPYINPLRVKEKILVRANNYRKEDKND